MYAWIVRILLCLLGVFLPTGVRAEAFNVRDIPFGAVGDGITVDTEAFVRVSQAITNADGGILIIPAGTYVVGRQSPIAAGYNPTQGNPLFVPSPIVRILNCSWSCPASC